MGDHGGDAVDGSGDSVDSGADAMSRADCDVCDEESAKLHWQIARLKAICVKERFWQIWKAGECPTIKRATDKAERQLAQEYPEIAWDVIK